MANVDIRQGYKNAAWFTSNATLVLKEGQVVHLEQTGTYKVGDGTTQLSALAFLGGSGGGGQVDTVQGTTNRISVDATDPENPILNISSAYDTAITNAIADAVSGKEDVSNKQTDLTPSATKYPTVDAVIAGLSAKKNNVIIHHSHNGAFSPADATYYYFGFANQAQGTGVNNTAKGVREMACPVTGKITGCVISIYCLNGASVSSEANTLVLRNSTQDTLHTISTTFTYQASLLNFLKSQFVSGLNISVTAGDMLQSVIGAPNFATNPTSTWFNFFYIVEL